MTERKVEKPATKKLAAQSLQRALASQPRTLRLTEGHRETFRMAKSKPAK